MNNPDAEPVLCRNYRLSFDINVSYQLLDIDPKYPGLVALREHLLDQEDLLDQLMVNKGLTLLADFLGQMQICGGIQGFEPDDLLRIAARHLKPEIIFEWQDAEINGESYGEPVIFDALSGLVVGWCSERIDRNL